LFTKLSFMVVNIIFRAKLIQWYLTEISRWIIDVTMATLFTTLLMLIEVSSIRAGYYDRLTYRSRFIEKISWLTVDYFAAVSG
jgi:hypothetical protein